MTMHLIQGMTSNSTKKRKLKRTAGWKKYQDDHKDFLKKMGIGKRIELKGVDVIDNTHRRKQELSNVICSNGIKKDTPQLTAESGIAGIVTTHKSNLMPIRKDNRQGMIDAANMRR